MRLERVGVVLAVAVGLAGLPGCVAENEATPASDASVATISKGGDDVNGEYLGVADWWKAHPESAAGYSYAQVSGVVADTPDRIIVGIRGDRTPEGEERPSSSNYLVVVNRSGDIVERWTQWDTLTGFPHQLYISPYDPERHIWVVDRGGTMKTVHEQILKL
jgi:hypothetical protein